VLLRWCLSERAEDDRSTTEAAAPEQRGQPLFRRSKHRTHAVQTPCSRRRDGVSTVFARRMDGVSSEGRYWRGCPEARDRLCPPRIENNCSQRKLFSRNIALNLTFFRTHFDLGEGAGAGQLPRLSLRHTPTSRRRRRRSLGQAECIQKVYKRSRPRAMQARTWCRTRFPLVTYFIQVTPALVIPTSPNAGIVLWPAANAQWANVREPGTADVNQESSRRE